MTKIIQFTDTIEVNFDNAPNETTDSLQIDEYVKDKLDEHNYSDNETPVYRIVITDGKTEKTATIPQDIVKEIIEK